MIMSIRDKFEKIRDYVDSQNIVDELPKFLSEDELAEFCDWLQDEFDVELEEDDYMDEYDD